jgi:hypothetical protein
MSKFESFGDGMNGRVDGPLFDSRAFLIPSSLALGSIIEAAQTEVQGISRDSINFSDPVHQLIGNIAFMPLDAKALGVSFAAAAATQMSYAARSVKEIYVENGLIGIGIAPEAAVEKPSLTRRRKLGALAITGLAAAVAYKVSENFNQAEDLIISTGLISLSTLHFARTHNKFAHKKR